MAPGLVADVVSNAQNFTSATKSTSSFPEPLKLKGVLEKFKYEDLTPIIGREYGLNIVDDLVSAPNADELLRDLAITISQRGVVFFRAQHNLTDARQKELVLRLGQLTGKPASSTLHLHPVLNSTSEFGVGDDHISHISSLARKKLFIDQYQRNPRRYDAAKWHSDIQFEHAPADYTSLRLTQLPRVGGDTLWASGYEIYDRFSPAYQKFLEGLTATFSGDGFLAAAERDPEHVKVHDGPRGSPLNVGRHLAAVHPVVRTNPITGWKSLFSVGTFPKYINELTAEESDDLLKKFVDIIYQNHDLQVRFRWKSGNDFAIWDNRSVFHCATFDYDGMGERFGNRAVGIGEAPYLDPHSTSRTEALQGEVDTLAAARRESAA